MGSSSYVMGFASIVNISRLQNTSRYMLPTTVSRFIASIVSYDCINWSISDMISLYSWGENHPCRSLLLDVQPMSCSVPKKSDRSTVTCGYLEVQVDLSTCCHTIDPSARCQSPSDLAIQSVTSSICDW